MMFRTAALTALLAATVSANEVPLPCFEYDDLSIDLGPEDCRSRTVSKKFGLIFNEVRAGRRCKGGLKRELQALTNTTTFDHAEKAIKDMCTAALAKAAAEADETSWSIAGVDMEEYMDGEGFLNTETGNFQQTERLFNKKGGHDRFIHIGTDPRPNDHYPTSEESYAAGQAVYDLFEGDAKTKYLKAPTIGFQEGCESKTAMCCWSRDRQYFDGNGNCNFGDCAGANPGDNTDLCWTKAGDEVFPYPGNDSEQDLHCHGISWTDDESDINTKARWNNLFYVSMVDHMYKRGYVESITSDPIIQGKQAMCGCIEDMGPVARADCNEMKGLSNYTISLNSDNLLDVNHVDDTFTLKFQACEGFEYQDLGPEDFEDERDNLDQSDNDLSGFIFKQYLKGKIDEATVNLVEQTLIGYRNPDVNNANNDEEARNAACANAFAVRYPDLTYEEHVIELSEIEE